MNGEQLATKDLNKTPIVHPSKKVDINYLLAKVRQEKKMVHPTIGHIYYAEITNLEGGFLEIAPDQNIDKGKFKKIYTYDDHTERYKPLENRLIIFNPSRLHGVSKIHKGIRKAFLANALSGPKIGSPNLLAILDVGPVYLAMSLS